MSILGIVLGSVLEIVLEFILELVLDFILEVILELVLDIILEFLLQKGQMVAPGILNPNDPFERRDRGFLLHQLDCFKVAYDDYQYFVEQCPKDPAAQLLKLQLDKISISDTILH